MPETTKSGSARNIHVPMSTILKLIGSGLGACAVAAVESLNASRIHKQLVMKLNVMEDQLWSAVFG